MSAAKVRRTGKNRRVFNGEGMWKEAFVVSLRGRRGREATTK
jgi:hypothetical protein